MAFYELKKILLQAGRKSYLLLHDFIYYWEKMPQPLSLREDDRGQPAGTRRRHDLGLL